MDKKRNMFKLEECLQKEKSVLAYVKEGKKGNGTNPKNRSAYEW